MPQSMFIRNKAPIIKVTIRKEKQEVIWVDSKILSETISLLRKSIKVQLFKANHDSIKMWRQVLIRRCTTKLSNVHHLPMVLYKTVMMTPVSNLSSLTLRKQILSRSQVQVKRLVMASNPVCTREVRHHQWANISKLQEIMTINNNPVLKWPRIMINI